MITGAVRSQVDKVWDAFWSGGVSNPLTVIEQITYLLFAKRLDDIHTAKEKQANLLKTKIENPIFGAGQDHLRWSRFKDYEAEQMYEVFRDEVFPFIKEIHDDDDSVFAKVMADAVFVIPMPSLLSAVVDLISGDRGTKGDWYEYMLGKITTADHNGQCMVGEITTAAQNGQFRTPRHLIRMMVDMMEPTPKDIIADPVCGTCGFLVSVGEYLREHPKHKSLFHNKKQLAHFQNDMFHGNDFDGTMLRIGAMNMMLHGIESPNLTGEDSLSQGADATRERYTLILANPPSHASLNLDETAKDLLQMCDTYETELLFLALFLAQLKAGGRCAVIVPNGVLFESSKAHQQIREQLVDGQKLDAVITMPIGVFQPYESVSTAILIFTKTNSGGTDHVWFYHMTADGLSLDDKREPVEQNDISDVLAQWKQRDPTKKTDRKAKAFFVPVEEIRENKYKLSIKHYMEIEYDHPLLKDKLAMDRRPSLILLSQGIEPDPVIKETTSTLREEIPRLEAELVDLRLLVKHLKLAFDQNKSIETRYLENETLTEEEVQAATLEMADEFRLWEEENRKLLESYKSDMESYERRRESYESELAVWRKRPSWTQWLYDQPYFDEITRPTYSPMEKPALRPPISVCITTDQARLDVDANEWKRICQSYKGYWYAADEAVIKSDCSRARKQKNQVTHRLKEIREKVGRNEFEEHRTLEKAKISAKAGKTRRLAAAVRRQIRRQEEIHSGCPYCGEELVEPHADHIYPVSRGGLSIVENMVFVCSTCNLAKSNLSLWEFVKRRKYDWENVTSALEKLSKRF